MRKRSKEFRQRPLIIFYILLIYIFASLVWWTYLLLGSGKNTLMIYGESTVFLILLVLAAVRIRRSYLQELELARQQQNFLLSITHELKSPLSSIRLGLETMTKQNLDPAKQRLLLENSLEDTERLQTLVEDILFAARFDDEGHQFKREGVDLSGVVSDISRLRVTKAGDTHRLQLEVERGINITGDRQALSLVIGNLVDNALRYSPAGTKISVVLKRLEAKVVLSVADEGPGIPASERKKIFRRFYRVGNEDTRKSKGTGLGLFIVKQIVERHGGKVSVRDADGGSARFEVVVPTEGQR